MPTLPAPIETLQTAVTSYTPYLKPSGQLTDPVIGEPTQYSTPYHALCQAVLALKGDSTHQETHLDNALRGFKAALKHVADPELRLNVSTMDREIGRVQLLNHRDFFWPPLLKIYRIFKQLDVPEVTALAEQIAETDILNAFRARPPSNWAAVWLSGEWLRFSEGLSPFSLDQIDAWLGQFFENHILIDLGLYQEPGHSNSYDLFTRYHLADMLLNGYAGAWREQMESLLATGFERSLQVQLSDGSLASAHRSTGQTWTLGVQVAYFTLVANYFKEQGKGDKVEQAQDAARRAFASFIRWQRPQGPYSPVENLLPPAYRVGYESYTFNGTYANLAMGFLGVAITNGFDCPAALPVNRPPGLLIEDDPVYRAIAHNGPYSLHINTFPAPHYDGFGIVDLTFGLGRRFHLVSSIKHLASGRLYNLGLALRPEAGLSELTVIAQQAPRLIVPMEKSLFETSFQVKARIKGSPYSYELIAQAHPDSVFIEERTPNLIGYKTLLIPYLRDGGWGETTQVDAAGSMVRFVLGNEWICMEIFGAVERVLDLPHGFENRRGLCGLLRIDLAEPREGISYRLVVER